MAREYSDETRGAVMAALLTGQSVSSVAREYNVPKGTVSRWKALARGEATREPGEGSEGPRTQKEESRVGPLVLKYLDASLESLIEQVKVFGDTVWLKQQDASELAVLHGVQMDKAIRLVELLSVEPADD